MAKKQKNIAAKIAASVALLAILLSIIGTGALVVFSSLWATDEATYEFTPEQFDEIKSMKNDIEEPQEEIEIREQLEEILGSQVPWEPELESTEEVPTVVEE